MALVVREVRPEEHEAVGELTARTYLDEGFANLEYASVLRDTAARAASATVLVGELDGRLVGSVTVATRGGDYAEQADEGEAVIRMLVVADDARGTGAGRALVEAAITRAGEDGCSIVRLSTQPSMQAAHRLYAKLGFVRSPERDWTPVPGIDLLGYALPLAPWCTRCGGTTRVADHGCCATSADLEPPRYCAECRRRMVVQVLPQGWTARCVEHGTTSG